MNVEWQGINGEQYFNDPVHGWLKRLPFGDTVPRDAVYACGTEANLFWGKTAFAGSVYLLNDFIAYKLIYATPCDPPCALSPQTHLDVCLEYVVYRVEKATRKMPVENREAFLQKVYALKQEFATGVDKLLSEVQQ